MLISLIRNPAQGPLTEILEAELIIGASTGPAPGR
jgi:LacI family transcriptional regulator